MPFLSNKRRNAFSSGPLGVKPKFPKLLLLFFFLFLAIVFWWVSFLHDTVATSYGKPSIFSFNNIQIFECAALTYFAAVSTNVPVRQYFWYPRHSLNF